MTGRAQHRHHEISPKDPADLHQLLCAALAIGEAEYMAFRARQEAERPVSVLDAMFGSRDAFAPDSRVWFQPRLAALPERKRMLVAVWDALPGDARQAFLAKIGPDGTFRRGHP